MSLQRGPDTAGYISLQTGLYATVLCADADLCQGTGFILGEPTTSIFSHMVLAPSLLGRQGTARDNWLFLAAGLVLIYSISTTHLLER